jgi:hypothetical protein
VVCYLGVFIYYLLIINVGAISIEQFIEEAEDSLAAVQPNPLLERDVLVTHFLAGYKYNVDECLMIPLCVHSASDIFVESAPLSCDVDSFAYVGYQVPIRAVFGLVFRPAYYYSFKANRGVTWSHPQYTANVEVPANKVPNFHFLKNDRVNVGYIYTYC